MNNECVFCRIVAGSIPAVRVYEDGDTVAFMDIAPIVKGHTLVIPREHHASLTDTPAALLEKLIVVVQKMAKAQLEGLRADGVNVMQTNGRAAGQEIAHIHFHVIPRFARDGYSFNWKPSSYESRSEMEQLAARIREALNH